MENYINVEKKKIWYNLRLYFFMLGVEQMTLTVCFSCIECVNGLRSLNIYEHFLEFDTTNISSPDAVHEFPIPVIKMSGKGYNNGQTWKT